MDWNQRTQSREHVSSPTPSSSSSEAVSHDPEKRRLTAHLHSAELPIFYVNEKFRERFRWRREHGPFPQCRTASSRGVGTGWRRLTPESIGGCLKGKGGGRRWLVAREVQQVAAVGCGEEAMLA
jgi:hypothetical protein